MNNKPYHNHCSSCNTDIKQRLKSFCASTGESYSEINQYFIEQASRQTLSNSRWFEIYYKELDEFLEENSF